VIGEIPLAFAAVVEIGDSVWSLMGGIVGRLWLRKFDSA